MSRRVTVLMGGASAERDVSLRSGAAAAAALEQAGFTVATIDAGRDVTALAQAITASRPDVVFNALHGRFGEDGCVQGLLNLLGIPYTHSGLLASAAAMDKAFSRQVFQQAGIPVAHGVVVEKTDGGADPMKRPFVVKPINEGSSVGVYVMKPGDNRAPPGRLAVRVRPRAGGRIRPRARADRGGDGRPRPGLSGNHLGTRLLRL